MHDHDHDRGLPHDLATLLTRRRALGLLSTAAAVGAMPALSQAAADVIAKGADGRTCVVYPPATAGPFPANGSNRAYGRLANVLADSGIVKRDMRTNLGRAVGTGTDGAATDGAASGVSLALTISLVAVGATCMPLAGHAVYLWHCDAAGRYSIYDLKDASYLRAVGVGDRDGVVRFDTIVPGCYPGRYPHMHVEVYPSLATATDYRSRILTSQLALPAAACTAAYRAHPAYLDSIGAFARMPLERDGLFRDSSAAQMAAQTIAVTGDPRTGYTGTVVIGLGG